MSTEDWEALPEKSRQWLTYMVRLLARERFTGSLHMDCTQGCVARFREERERSEPPVHDQAA